MTDKELLEAAARAAGYPIPNPVGRYPTSGFKEDGTFYWRSGDDYREERTWNPLKDDGDAFRLMVDLCLAVHCDEEGALVWHSHDVCGSYGFAECDVSDSCDKKQAVRRAIVMSAVEIGKCK